MGKTDNYPEHHRLINSLIETSCRRFGPRPALSMALHEPITYAGLLEKTCKLAGFLTGLGVRKGDRIAILAENSPNWGIAYLAIVKLGAVAVPVLPDFTGPDVRNILLEAGVRILFTTGRQLEKVHELNTHHPLTRIITLDESREDGTLLHVQPFSLVLEHLAPEAPTASAHEAVDPDDVASLIYTSGTSGHSKAVLLTHANLVANVLAANRIYNLSPEATFLSLLPLSHTYEFTLGFLLPLLNGGRVVYLGKPPTPSLLETVCRHEQPTVICAVPLILEKIYKKTVKGPIDRHPALRLAIAIPWLRGWLFARIGKKLLAFFGGRLEVLAIGGAHLLFEVEKFLAAAGLPYIIGYGLTEAAPLVSAGPFGDQTVALGSAGKPVPGVAVHIRDADPATGIGEILVRGPNVMKGYFNNPELTAATMDRDGWLATGDLGFLDRHGNLFITGRHKNVIVLAHGENICPEIVEDKLNSSSYVAESLVTEQNGRLVAHVFLEQDHLDQAIMKNSQADKARYLEQLLKSIQKEVNRQLPLYSQLSAIIERREPFIKTATQKIKRHLYTR